MDIFCEQCNKKFHRKPSHIKKNNFCSKTCYGKWLKENKPKLWGVNHPNFPEEKRKKAIKKARIKKKGKPAWNKGKKLGFIPETAFKKGEYAGKKHPRWKGGNIFYWKKMAHKRDDYTCRNCGLREPEIMDIAHIKGIKENRFVAGHKGNKLKNLLTLCPNCHRRFDKGLLSSAQLKSLLNNGKA